MASFNSFSQEKNLYSTIYAELKALGVKVPKPKKLKSSASKLEVFVSERSCKIFGVNLRDQEWISNGEYPIPKFVALTTEYLQKFTHVEGIFRKGGNVVRQRKMKATIEKGGDIQGSEPHDVAAVLKQWLRELPEPLIPSHLQELFIRCHCLEVKKDRETAYLFSFLLLPTDHQHTLKHLLRFFANVARESGQNKMGTYNLALILAPNVFALKETADKARNDMIFQHTEIIQVLIENSDKVGLIPPTTLLYQTSLLGSDLTTSIDVLDMGPGKYRKRMSGTVQDLVSGFRRLVGQNVSIKSCSVADLAETSFPRQSISLDDLDNNTFVTPENKGRTIPEKTSSRHSRRKSFGALFLRRREKKSKSSGACSQMKVIDIPLDSNVSEQRASCSSLIGSKCQLNLNFTHSFPIEEKQPSMVPSEGSEPVTARPVAPTRSDSITVVKKSETEKLLVENAAESIRMPFSKEPTSRDNASKIEVTSSNKSGLSRQEAFSIKPPKNRLQNIISDKMTEKDSKLDNLNENIKTDNLNENIKTDNLNENIKTDNSSKLKNNSCFHSHSSCNLRCCKNKSVCEKKIAQNKSRAQVVTKRRPQSLRISRRNECPGKKLSPSFRVGSHQNIAGKSSPPGSPREEVSAASVTQSLDLSLSLLLQNFCMSPPLDAHAPEFRLSIDISSDKKNSELKVNISKKETPVENRPKNTNGPNTNEAANSNPRKRLSSHSDSRIPRLKKTLNPNRPSSFHGNIGRTKCRDHQVQINEKSLKRHSTKIPLLKIEGKSPSTPKDMQDQDFQSPNDSCFRTPDSTFNSETSLTWANGSHYLSALASPDDSMANKRESIVKILKYNPGHVLSKISLFDSKGSSGSESDCKLTRTSSEKYSSVSRCTRPKLTVSNSYNAVGRSDSLRYGNTPYKHEPLVPRRVSFKATDSPLTKSNEPIKAKGNDECNDLNNGSSKVDRPKSLTKK